MKKRGLLTTLFAVAISLIGISSFAMAPTIRDLPDVCISDQEDNIGTDNNWFVYTDAFEFDSFVQDGDTTLSDLLWSFDEGDPDTGWFAINGVTAVHLGTTGIASDSPTIQPAHVRPDLEVPNKNIRQVSTATFRDILFSPLSGSPPFPNPSEDHSAGKVVRFYVSDGTNVATQDVMVKTIDNVLGDSLSGGTCFDVDQTRINMDDQTFMTNVAVLTAGATTGWAITDNSYQSLGYAVGSYDAANQALRINVAQGTGTIAGKQRIQAFQSANDQWYPFAAIATDEYVRVKMYIFHTGQANPSDLNQIPNFRIRASQRFAVNSMVEIFNHISTFPATAALTPELRPSNDPNNPSLYRVDISPLRVTKMNDPGEGILRAFEAYSLNTEPQENGSIELTESIIGTYNSATCVENEVLRQTYVPSASDAGDLKIFTSASDINIQKLIAGVATGDSSTADTTAGGLPTHTQNNTGVTFDTTAVATDRIGLGAQEFDAAHFGNALIARVNPNKQYRIAWVVTSTSNSNTNPQMRLRARSIGFAWSQKFEVGGALAGGVSTNQPIARQSLPGNGSEISTDSVPGTYTMLMHTPMSTDIRASQPLINAQPGYGSASTSRRDIRTGWDIVDTLSGAAAEQGNFKVRSINVFEADLVSD